MPEFTGHKDLRSYLRMFWRWKFVVLVLVVGAPAIAYWTEHNKPHIYQSSVLVAVNTATTSGGSSSNPYTTTNITAIAQLLTTTPVANIAGSLMKPPVSGDSISGEVSADPNPSTGFMTITATDTDPVRAAEVANAFGTALGINEHAQTVQGLNASIRQLREQLANMKATNPSYAELSQQLSTDRSQLAETSQGATILQAATPNYTPIGPDKKRAVLLGLVIGVLLAVGVITLLESFDRRMRSPDDLESLTDLPLLAAIAPTAFTSELSTAPADEESFQMLRTALTYFTVDRPLHSVMFTSPGEKEGKSTVAARLALACAHAGLNVVLVDADLRRAGTSDRFGLRDQAGLGVVLSESRPVNAALVEWKLPESGVGRLRVLPAGPPPPNPGALVSSEAMRKLLSSLESDSDLVVVDSPAALAVSDAVPLMRAVSGVVLVARMNHSSRDTIHRLHKMIESAHGRLLGVVATGVTSGPGYEKYSQEYYALPAGKAKLGRKGKKKHKKQTKQKSSNSGGVQLAQAERATPEPAPAAGSSD